MSRGSGEERWMGGKEGSGGRGGYNQVVLYERRIKKKKKVTLVIVSLPGNRTVIKTPQNTIRVDSSASPAEEFTEEPGSPVKARPTCNAHVLGRVS